VVIHVHDEIVVECAIEDAEFVAKKMTSIMCKPPVWANGLPLDVEISTMTRYGK
jgi:DNA polymerase I-like protein with 3'-5' exonuclease and polymerase domains